MCERLGSREGRPQPSPAHNGSAKSRRPKEIALERVYLSSLAGAGLLLAGPLAGQAAAQKQVPPKLQVPQPGVPQVMTMEEDKLLDENYKDVKKQMDDAFKKKN